MILWNTPEAQKKLIERLIEGEKNLTELAKSLEMSKSGVLKHLEKLLEAGIVRKEMVTTEIGRESVYSLRRTSFFLSFDPGTSSIINIKTHSSFDPRYILTEQISQPEIRKEIKFLLNSLRDVPFTVLFGSTAQGKATWKSDIDILFLKEGWSNESIDQLKEELSGINMELNHQIKPIFKTFSEFKKGEDLLEEIKQEGIIIYGDIFDLKEIWQMMKRYKSIKN